MMKNVVVTNEAMYDLMKEGTAFFTDSEYRKVKIMISDLRNEVYDKLSHEKEMEECNLGQYDIVIWLKKAGYMRLLANKNYNLDNYMLQFIT